MRLDLAEENGGGAAARHAGPRLRVGARRRALLVVDVQPILAGAALDGHAGLDVVQRVRVVAHGDPVVAVLAVDDQRGGRPPPRTWSSPPPQLMTVGRLAARSVRVSLTLKMFPPSGCGQR